MKKTSVTIEPTKTELDILLLLWEHGPSTVRFINDELNKAKEVQYTSTLKQMQVMAEKGLLTRDESQMKHLYSPVEKEEKLKNRHLEKMLDSFYHGSVSDMAMQLLGNKRTSKADIDNIKRILKDLEKSK